YRWLARHPSAWEVPPRQRRAIRRTARTVRRVGLRPPLRRRVADAETVTPPPPPAAYASATAPNASPTMCPPPMHEAFAKLMG
ncbi:MAG: hypothetical protein ACT4NY_16845, partial [Pseudonocardiales bacterium]